MARTCPRCSSPIDSASNLCPSCLFGEGLKEDTISCPGCQAALDEGASFCSHCGAPATAATPSGDAIRSALTEKLGSQYRIVRLLGRGGMGAVYLARDLTLEREVAIKVVTTEDHTQGVYQRFRREAKVAARLSHPNIVPLHAFGEIDGMPYFVMGYVRGESVADRLRRDGKLPEDEARRIIAEVADALDHAHRQGVVHRDIKPDNVLLDDETGRALLTDFGVARAQGHGETLTRTGSVVGTPHYMSPEQASGNAAVDGRSDLYSLGVMAYAMVAGRLPFEGSTPADVLAKHLTQEPVPLRSLVPAISDSLALAVDRCLAKAPADRWPDGRSIKLSLGATDESQLPEPLQSLDGSGIWCLEFLIGCLTVIILTGKATGADRDPDLRAIHFGTIVLLALPAIFMCFYAFLIVKLKRQGIGAREAHRAIWREPSWWPSWYPRSLRRTGNVWNRLPWYVRYYRAWPLHIILYGSVVVLLSEGFGYSFYYDDNPIAVWIFFGGLFAVAGVWFALAAHGRRTLQLAGLAGGDVSRVMIKAPPSRTSFWSRPHIASILAPAVPTESKSGSPHEQMQSILRQANDLSGPLRHLGAQAAAAARHLVASIELIDREIGELACHFEPDEEKRLTDKIESMSLSETSADVGAPMRALLEKQLDLIRDLSARIEESRARRNRRLEMLRTLALHIAALHARVDKTPSELREITDNVRALCDDVEHHAATMESSAAEVPTVRIPGR